MKTGTPGPDTSAATSDGTGRDRLSVPDELKSSLRILVVDDDRTLREGCVVMLQSEGYNVTATGRAD
jgi:PleD family two-component response regulator